ncbi:hypothetical protein [Duganella callida]|uniref:Uncharacterized protein n=1 Tax=Duganella callida TaxID=2561932 RepID=A0A4Y9SBP1_9BURK|nr:hypothetical protein [Duganella callida]TFW19583.1 hypothetical protein E4L98_16025 [Duganella callida]
MGHHRSLSYLTAGLAGLALLWRLAQRHAGTALWISQCICVLGLAGLVTLIVTYGVKAVSRWTLA